MPIGIRAGGSASYYIYNPTGTTTLVVSIPSGTQTGDLMVASVTTDTGEAFTPPSGWTAIENGVTSGAYLTGSCACYRFAQSGDSSWNFTWAGPGYCSATIQSVTGANAANPIDATGTAGTSTNAATATAGSVTAVDYDCLLMVAVASSAPGTFSATGFSEVDSGSVNQPCTGFLWKGLTANGATGSTTVTSSAGATLTAITAIPFTIAPANFGVLAATAAGDTISASGHFATSASIAHTAAGDSFLSPGLFPFYLAATAAGDSLSGTGGFKSPASLSPTAAGDAFATPLDGVTVGYPIVQKFDGVTAPLYPALPGRSAACFRRPQAPSEAFRPSARRTCWRFLRSAAIPASSGLTAILT